MKGPLPPVSGALLAAALALQLPEPRPSAAELQEAGAALQSVAQQRRVPVCDPAHVFGAAAYSPAIAALSLPSLLALVLVCDLAALPAQLTGIVHGCMAQRSARQPRGAFEAQVAALSPRCAALLRSAHAALLQLWWRDTYRGADFGPVIKRGLAAWRAANPNALVANVCGRKDLTDSDFADFSDLKALNMGLFLGTPRVTDAAFAHLAGIHSLDMRGCSPLIIKAVMAQGLPVSG